MLSPEVVENAEKRVGETVGGKWHLDRVIGVGGMAAVYEATHRNRNRVALKLLHPALSIEEGTRQRFLREGYVANTIRHDGAVQVLDDDVTDDGYAFLVMELLKGESLEERMQRKGGALDVREALQITEQLLDVLEAAHDQNVVHRDIKPDNLFITEEGKLKVLDFGIARLHRGDGKTTKVGSFMGTPAFCAQEQARGRWDEVDHRTDLYSVGASLFTCVTGVHVHEAETSSEQLALAIGATARSLASVMPQAPKELVDLVDTALAYDKEDRFQSARAMRAAVRRVIAGLPVETKISTPPPPSGVRTFGPDELDPDSIPPAREPRNSVRIAAGVLAAAFLAVLIFFMSSPERPKVETQEAVSSPRPAAEKTAASKVEVVEPNPDVPTGAKGDLVEQDEGEAAPGPSSPDAKAQGSKTQARPSSVQKPPPPRAPAPSPEASGVTASFPSPSSDPSSDEESSDEDMFNKRF